MEAIGEQIPAAEMERMMKAQEVILKAAAGKLTGWLRPRSWCHRPNDAALARAAQRARLQRSVGLPQATAKPKAGANGDGGAGVAVIDFNVRHFHEKLREVHGIKLSYSWVKTALQTAGFVKKRKKPGSHRRRRSRRPLAGMMLRIDGSEHRWFGDDRYYELIVILDDATSEIYYAQIVQAEGTRTVMAALREVIETNGSFCSLYSDRAGHFFVTPKRGERVDTSRPTQVGRALQELAVRMIAAYAARSRSMEAKLWDVAGATDAGNEVAWNHGFGSGR